MTLPRGEVGVLKPIEVVCPEFVLENVELSDPCKFNELLVEPTVNGDEEGCIEFTIIPLSNVLDTPVKWLLELFLVTLELRY